MKHPAAKSMIELSRAQDESVGDGTTSVIILGIFIILLFYLFHYFFFPAGEMLQVSKPHLERGIHPTVVIAGFIRFFFSFLFFFHSKVVFSHFFFHSALDDALVHLKSISVPLDPNNREQMLEVVKTCIGTKFIGRWSNLMCSLALDAVNIVKVVEEGYTEIDIKKYARIEKVFFFFFLFSFFQFLIFNNFQFLDPWR